MNDQELEQQARELILQYQREDYQFPARASKEIDTIGNDLEKQAAVCRRFLGEIEETKQKRETEVEQLCQGDFERKVKLWREVRELAIRAHFMVEWIAHRREKGRDFKRAGSDSFEQGKVYKRIEEEDKLIQQATKAAIDRMNRELDDLQAEVKKTEERRRLSEAEALRHKVDALEAAMKGMELQGSNRKAEDLPQDRWKAEEAETDTEVFKHTPDYISVNLRGQHITLSPRQAEVIQFLHEAYKKGTPDLHQDQIATKLKILSVKSVFRSSPEARKSLIAKGKKRGTLHLSL